MRVGVGVGETAAALGIAQVVLARECLRVDFEQAVAPRPIRRDQSHHGVDGARVIGAQREHRGGRVARTGAAEAEARGRRFAHLVETGVEIRAGFVFFQF